MLMGKREADSLGLDGPEHGLYLACWNGVQSYLLGSLGAFRTRPKRGGVAGILLRAPDAVNANGVRTGSAGVVEFRRLAPGGY